MKTPTGKNIGYAPGIVPGETTALISFLQEELSRISAAISSVSEGHIEETHVAPAKPATGDIRLADGSDWNPGNGKGLYVYYNDLWNSTEGDGSVILSVYESAPSPQIGMMVIADGTNWDPGSGLGVYCYYGSAWNKLG